MLSEYDLVRLLSRHQVKFAIASADEQITAVQHHALHLRRVSQAWEAIYWVEVPLRNRIHQAFVDHFGPQWWTSRSFRVVVGDDLAAEANTSRSSQNPDRLFLDDLTLGFWVKCLASNQDQRTWVRFLYRYFAAGTSRKTLHRNLSRLKTLRNVIAHHGSTDRLNSAEVFELAIAIAGSIDRKLEAYLIERFRRLV